MNRAKIVLGTVALLLTVPCLVSCTERTAQRLGRIDPAAARCHIQSRHVGVQEDR